MILTYSRGRAMAQCACGKQTGWGASAEALHGERRDWFSRHRDHNVPGGRQSNVTTDMERLAHRILRSTSARERGV